MPNLPEGLGACDPEAIRIAVGIADGLGFRLPVQHLRAVDHGAAVLVVNSADGRAPGDRTLSQRRRRRAK